MQIYLVTQNAEKLRVANKIFEGTDIQIKQKSIDTPEIQSIDGKKIAEYSAQYAANLLKKPILKTDASWEIQSLKNFPGPFTKYINDWIGEQGYLNLLKDNKNRKVIIREYLSYCEPNKKPITFVGIAEGTISMKPKGKRGTIIDKIFIPKGTYKTAAQLTNEEMTSFWAKSFTHWREFQLYLKNKNALWVLAKIKQLPIKQHMDRDSLDWLNLVISPNLNQAKKTKITKINWNEISAYFPKETDYLDRQEAHTIHGIAHTIRVIIYLKLLISNYNFDKFQLQSLFEAAKLHDTARINDKEDIYHGLRASSKAKSYLAQEIIKKHSENNPQEIIEVKLFKLADALDRYRQPKTNWFPQKDLLDKQACNLLELAKFLTYRSECLKLENYSPEDAVKSAAKEIGLIS